MASIGVKKHTQKTIAGLRRKKTKLFKSDEYFAYTDAMQLEAYLSSQKEFIEQSLRDRFAPLPAHSALHEALTYSVLNGGKRIRPILTLATAQFTGGTIEESLSAALAVELFHCSTLIHDDLPCMDDDDLRRGKPTTHIKFGEANAVLAGDALIVEAFKILAEEQRADLIYELAAAAGKEGVIAGQVADLAAEHMSASADLVDYIHYHKTGILIRAAIRMGAIAVHASANTLEKLTTYGEKIGVAFQIQDDILDQTASSDTLGKTAGSDVQQAKMTYPSVHGLAASEEKVRSLTEEARHALQEVEGDHTILLALANYLVERKM